MILTRSPYYINDNIIYADIPRGILELYIWSGTVGSKPATPTYTITKGVYYKTPGTSNLTFEISNLIRDYYNHSPIYSATTGVLINGEGSVLYVEGKITYPVGIQPPEVRLRRAALDGYGYFMEGVNSDIPDNYFLLSNDYYVVNKKGFFNVPFRNIGIGGMPTPIYVNGVSYVATNTVNTNNEINNLWLNLSFFTEDIEIEYEGNTIYLKLQEECKYTPQDIMFLNKYGAWEIMTFFKAYKENLKTESKDFKNGLLTSGTYSTSKAQYQRYNVNGRESLKLNSGFLPESYNETVKQLLLSEHVYLLNGGNHIPLIVKTSSYEYKTRLVDKLISHEIDFDYAFDLINNI